LASKRNVKSNFTGLGEHILEANFLKRIFAVAPLQINTSSNLNDSNDPKNANLELSIDGSVMSPPSQEALDLKADKTYVDAKIDSLVMMHRQS
jgi:hypothetical protein